MLEVTTMDQRMVAEDDPERRWLLSEEARRVATALACLAPRRKLIMALHLDGFSSAEIAHETGISQVSVRSHLRYAREQLRNLYWGKMAGRPAGHEGWFLDRRCVFMTNKTNDDRDFEEWLRAGVDNLVAAVESHLDVETTLAEVMARATDEECSRLGSHSERLTPIVAPRLSPRKGAVQQAQLASVAARLVSPTWARFSSMRRLVSVAAGIAILTLMVLTVCAPSNMLSPQLPVSDAGMSPGAPTSSPNLGVAKSLHNPDPPISDPDAEILPNVASASYVIEFKANTAIFADAAAAQEVIQDVIWTYGRTSATLGSYKPPVDQRPKVVVTGYAAAFVSADSARALSAERVRAVADLLVASGVRAQDLTISSVGYDRLANVDADPHDPAQRVVTILFVT
jgi:Sigma-70, region 4/OmpA family